MAPKGDPGDEQCSRPALTRSFARLFSGDRQTASRRPVSALWGQITALTFTEIMPSSRHPSDRTFLAARSCQDRGVGVTEFARMAIRPACRFPPHGGDGSDSSNDSNASDLKCRCTFAGDPWKAGSLTGRSHARFHVRRGLARQASPRTPARLRDALRAGAGRARPPLASAHPLRSSSPAHAAPAALSPRTLAARRTTVCSSVLSPSANSSPNLKSRNELPITKTSPAKW